MDKVVWELLMPGEKEKGRGSGVRGGGMCEESEWRGWWEVKVLREQR